MAHKASEADPSATLFAGMAATGIVFHRAVQHDESIDPLDDGPVYIWPECLPAWRQFIGLQDQWREGVLPRSEVLAHLQATVPDEAERQDLYRGVCACIGAVVAVHSEHRRAQDRERAAEARKHRK